MSKLGRPKPSLTSLQLLNKRIKEHVKEKGGISNEFIYNVCQMCCSSDFKGVFSADCIPPKLAGRGRFFIIVNLGERKGKNKTKAAYPNVVYYLDSYGFPCVQRYVVKFLLNCRRPMRWNSRQIQDFKSQFCGMYAILFTIYLDRSFGNRGTKPGFNMRFRNKNLIHNDSLCMQYLRRILIHRT